MATAGFRKRMLGREVLAGTFVRTPAYEMIEVLAMSGMDFVCLDGEHGPFDRGRMDACLAMARALDLPALVRVAAFTPQDILQALDSGATGVVVPHVFSAGKAEEVARAARFGLGGRGYAGSTRWAGQTQRAMADVLAQSRDETVVIAQIEEPEGVDAVDEIVATPGIDGLFIGPSDLSVAFGKTDTGSAELQAALARVGEACRAAGKAYMSYVPDAAKAQDWSQYGMTMFFMASEQSLMLKAARAGAAGVHAIGKG